MNNKRQVANKCPICNSKIFISLFSFKSQNFGLHLNEFKLLVCKNCDAIILNPFPSDEELNMIYQAVYKEKGSSSVLNKLSIFEFIKEKRDEAYKGKGNFIAKMITFPLIYTIPYRIRILKKYFRRKKINLLDIGCGDGSFILSAKKYLNNVNKVFGIDFSENAIEICKKRGINARNCKIDNISDKFNLVTAFHVLEHIKNQADFIKQIESKLVPGGLFVLSLPNTSGIGRILFGRNWAGFNIPRHVINYNKKTILLLFKNFPNLKVVLYTTRGVYLNSIVANVKSKVLVVVLKYLQIILSILPLFFNFGDEQIIVVKKL